jgi:hypothetical protein
LREVIHIAWERFKIIAAIVGDAQARIIATLFYFTILVPFGLMSRLSRKTAQQNSGASAWLDREPISSDIDIAKRQG